MKSACKFELKIKIIPFHQLRSCDVLKLFSGNGELKV